MDFKRFFFLYLDGHIVLYQTLSILQTILAFPHPTISISTHFQGRYGRQSHRRIPHWESRLISLMNHHQQPTDSIMSIGSGIFIHTFRSWLCELQKKNIFESFCYEFNNKQSASNANQTANQMKLRFVPSNDLHIVFQNAQSPFAIGVLTVVYPSVVTEVKVIVHDMT